MRAVPRRSRQKPLFRSLRGNAATVAIPYGDAHDPGDYYTISAGFPSSDLASLGHLKVNCREAAREATLGCPPGEGNFFRSILIPLQDPADLLQIAQGQLPADLMGCPAGRLQNQL